MKRKAVQPFSRAKAMHSSSAGILLAFAAAVVACAAFATPAAALLPAPSPFPTLVLPSPTLPVATPKLPLPSPTVPSLLPTPTPPTLPTPTPPITLTPTPSVPPFGASPSPTPAVPGAGGGGSTTSHGTSTGGGGGSTGRPAPGLPVPFTNFVLKSPFDVALAVSLAVLPLLLVIWLFVFGRTWAEARRARDADVRLALASDLGLSPRELGSLTTEGLFKLREQAAFDDLTGVLRRAAGIAALEREIARARRQKSPLTVAFVDLDGLKQANDNRGHAAGDTLLRDLATALKTGLRGQDLVLRYGGDEFVCVLPDTPSDSGGDKLRQIQTESNKNGLAFSLGLAELERSDDVVSLLGRADRELYDAKARRSGIQNLHPEGRRDQNGRRRVSA
jgi:diguanylate cyclase (GGDEF)-like protein